MKKILVLMVAVIWVSSLSAQRGFRGGGWHGGGSYHSYCAPHYGGGYGFHPYVHIGPVFRPYYRPWNPFFRPIISVPIPMPPAVVYNSYSSPNYATTDNSYQNNVPATTNSSSLSYMNQNDFERARSSVYSKSSEYGKLTVAKEIVDANYFSAEEVKEMMALFSAESSRLDFAKYAYNHTADRNNYFVVNDAFTSEDSINSLSNFINGK